MGGYIFWWVGGWMGGLIDGVTKKLTNLELIEIIQFYFEDL